MFTKTAREGWLPAARRSAGLMLLTAVALLATGCVQVQAADGGFVMGGSIIVEKGEVARDDVIAVGGNVRIDGRARRDVVVVGGKLVVNGEVNGSVSAVGGTLVLGPGARVEQDVVVVGSRLERHQSARIGGEFVNVSIGYGFNEWFQPMHWGWGGWWGFTPFAWVARTGQLFYWLLLALMAVALLGDRVSSAAHAISREPLRLGVIGVVAVFALCCAFVVLLVLSFLIIGIPFLLALFFMVPLAYIFGIVAVFQVVGNRVMHMVGRPEASQIAIVLTGGLVMGILRYVPFFGSMLWFFALLVGLGSVFATRFGTGRPWVRRSGAPAMPGGTPGAAPYAPPPVEPTPPHDAAAPAPAAEPAAAHGEVSFEEPDTSDSDDEQR